MKILISGAAALMAALFAAPASAVLISHTLGGNECGGGGFSNCWLTVNNDSGESIQLSPVIAKYNKLGDFEEASDRYENFDGDEINVTMTSSGLGTWQYTQGEGDPGIRFWAAKASNGFNLFWYVDTANEGTCTGNPYSLSCLNLAETVTEGSWSTPEDKELSHLTFFNSEPPTFVPEPGSLALIGLGLAGLGLARRKPAKI